jgi:uncharacterized membrane protein
VLREWLPRAGVAALFLVIGKSKFDASSEWVAIFDQVGFGQWLRYLTGTLQLGGALLVLVPRTFPVGIVCLAVTLVGAMLAWILRLGGPPNALIPGILLAAVVAVGADEVSELLVKVQRRLAQRRRRVR